jgi:hypothetical protein
MRKLPPATALKVIHDGLITEIKSGNYSEVEGKNIKVEPASKLDKGVIIVGTYHHIKN